MRRWIVLSSLAAALALPVLMTPVTASASCADRKATGTVLGGIGGALIGNSISGGGGGAIIGGLGGAVAGHQIAKGGCTDERRYRTSRLRRYRGSEGTATANAAGQPCRTEIQSYYDDRGALRTRQIQTCTR
jgi:uncharacterized protein YcfJ